MPPDPKPAVVERDRVSSRGRIVNSQAILRKCLAERECRIPGCREPSANGHHLIPRGQLGDDVEANIIPLCGSGTTGHHGAVEAEIRDVRAALGSALREDEVAYVLRKMGETPGRDWLRRRYDWRPE